MTPDALAALHARVFPGRPGWGTKDFTKILAAPGTILCARPHAFALGRTAADEAELLLIATDPDHRRTGLGLQCLRDFEDKARTSGGCTIFLEVALSNTNARAFYASNGYGETARREDYYRLADGSRDTALVLRKDLVTD